MSLFDAFGLNKKVDSTKESLSTVNNTADKIAKTDGVSPIGLVGKDGKRYPPGFTPNDAYNFGVVQNLRTVPGLDIDISSNATWFGSLLQTHPDYSSNTVNTTFNPLNASDRFDLMKEFPRSEKEIYSTRDHYLIFSDNSQDYFKHGLYIEGKTPLQMGNDRETFIGKEEGTPLKLSNFKYSSYENNDPVYFGFELLIDAVSSPLLNGSVEDFIDQFSQISEIASKRAVISDFKQQFIKIFKTKGTVKYDDPNRKTISIPDSSYANTDNQLKLYNVGKKAYLSYYLKKVDGLNLLIESNTGEKKKSLADYRKDLIKFSFLEDVSLTLGTLSHLYKLLYWSKPNAKNLIPENLLRFNCDIIISEVRHYNRVRKSLENGDLQILKENLSRHIYSLKECQFWFDQPDHESSVDLSGIKNFEDYTVSMDFKYSTSKFERWTPDGTGFGQYVGYNNGAIWKIGNPGARENITSGGSVISDISVPKFYTVGTNTLNQNGVVSSGNSLGGAIVLNSYNIVTNETIKKDIEETTPNGDETKTKEKSRLELFKESSGVAAKKLAKDLKKAAFTELQQQVNIRLRLLNNTIDKIRNSIGLGRMREPTNVYRDEIVNGINNQFFYDVHNALRDFLGDSLGGNIGGMIKGNDKTGLFG
jgi:hypothetical protein